HAQAPTLRHLVAAAALLLVLIGCSSEEEGNAPETDDGAVSASDASDTVDAAASADGTPSADGHFDAELDAPSEASWGDGALVPAPIDERFPLPPVPDTIVGEVAFRGACSVAGHTIP